MYESYCQNIVFSSVILNPMNFYQSALWKYINKEIYQKPLFEIEFF